MRGFSDVGVGIEGIFFGADCLFTKRGADAGRICPESAGEETSPLRFDGLRIGFL